MSDSYFGKGITVASGFDLSAKTPLDSRAVVNNFSELEEHVKNNRVYEGMIVYVISEQITVQYINASWIPFGSDVYEGTNIIIDNLNSLLANASLSANQGRILREMIETLQGNYYTKEEIDEIRRILENQDIEINQIVGDLEQFFPKKLSYFENDMNYLTEDDLEETLRYITIPAKTSDLINDAGYITQENLEENVVSKIPIKTSQLENDAEYITQENLEEALSGIKIDSDGYVHVGASEPSKEYLWIDTSTPSNLKVVNYDERVRLKCNEMLESVKNRLDNLSSKIDLIEKNINKISSSNADKITKFKTTLSTIRSQISILISQIENIQSSMVDLKTLKTNSRKVRKDSKSLIFTLLDFNDEVMRVLDSEITINNDIDDDDDDNDDDVIVTDVSLLTEDGLVLLTEDGLILLVDGVEGESEEVLEDSLLTETGLAILTESGLTLLIDKVESSEVLADAILTELGVVILTEQGKQILKG